MFSQKDSLTVAEEEVKAAATLDDDDDDADEVTMQEIDDED